MTVFVAGNDEQHTVFLNVVNVDDSEKRKEKRHSQAQFADKLSDIGVFEWRVVVNLCDKE